MATDEIGPYYKMFGIVLFAIGAGLGYLHFLKDTDTGLWDAVVLLAPMLAALALIRPNWFDDTFKSFMSWLPNKYEKPTK